MRYWIIIIFLGPGCLLAQPARVQGVIQDRVKDALPLAHITVMPDSITAVSDNRGRFQLAVTPGQKQFMISYTGYETLLSDAIVRGDTVLRFLLHSRTEQLDEVVITSDRVLQTELFQSTRSGTNVLSGADVSAVPVLGGEADLIKVLQLMPGSVRGMDGSSDLFVRGGAADQNLVLLDGTTIYNTSHLFGFVSVFNPDILESVESMNGGFPAQYGGRLSSILNVKTNAAIATDTHVSGDIGLVASRLYVEQPIIKEKLSIWVAGRRTYADQVVKLVGQELPYYFYDINAKMITKPTDRDEVEFSLYTGEDLLDIFRDRNNDGNGFLTTYKAGNNSQSVQWKHQLPNHWFSTVNASHTSFKYRIQNSFEENSLQAFSDIRDVGVKVTLGSNGTQGDGSLLAGIDWIRHAVSPSVLNSAGTISEFLSSSASAGRNADELSLFAQYEWPWQKNWTFNAGLRTSMAFVRNKMYVVPEPRMAIRYSIREQTALKFSYARMSQYMHRISYSAITSPTDIWYPVTDQIGPQTAHQISVAWQHLGRKPGVFMSVETYYKAMDNLIGLEEGTNLFFNSDFEPRLLQGQGRAFGWEVLVRKESGRFTGWISYTLAWSNRQFNALNGGQWFPSRYDRRHNGAIVGQYKFHDQWSVSLVWEYISGSRFTPIIGQYAVLAPGATGLNLLPVFAGVNSVKLSHTHRLDLGIKFRSKAGRKFRYELFAGVYNVYNRTNPVGINIVTSEEDGSLSYTQPGLFGLLPFINYGFNF